MPYKTEWVDPGVFLDHRGTKVYFTYKDDDVSQGARSHSFTLDDLCGEESCECPQGNCRYVFDVRELATWTAPAHPPYLTGTDNTPANRKAWDEYAKKQIEENAIKKAIGEALDRGLLTPPAP